MSDARAPNLFVIVLPILAALLLIDQITKAIAVAQLCVYFSESGLAACRELTGLRLVDVQVFAEQRLPTGFPLIDLDFHLNRNAALSIPLPGPIWFKYLLLVSIMGLLVWWLRAEGGRNNAIGVGLILGGALGNFMDRLVHGAVVDFLVLKFGAWVPFIFNVADAAITAGVIWLFIEQLILKPRRQAQAVVS